MKLICLVSLLILGTVSCLSIDDAEVQEQWELFKQQYRSDTNSYLSVDQEKYRRSVFTETYRKITKHNLEAEQGLHTYTMGVNQFSDMTQEEFLAKYTTPNLQSIDIQKLRPTIVNQSVSVPDSHDWRSQGKVGPVKNQGGCGSCWAFASVAIFESRLAIKRGGFRSLSEQEIIDCTSGYDCQHGGNIQMATDTLRRLGGIEGDSDYPYISGGGGKGQCHYDGGRRVASVGTNLAYLQGEEQMKWSTFTNGPVYVHIMANGNFQSYRGGVYADGSCNQPINHAVTIVGYGPGYWLVKNSWGGGWGEGGYIRMAFGQNMCRISESPIWTDDIN